MKKIILIIFLIIGLIIPSYSIAGGFKVNILGIDLEWLKKADTKDYLMLSLGFITRITVHELGHVLYLEKNDIEYNCRIDFPCWQVDYYDPTTMKQRRNFYRAGFFADTTIGLLLTNSSLNNSPFVKGYVLSHSLGLATYNIRTEKESNDFYNIKKYEGDKNLFKIFIYLGSIYNFSRQDW